MNEQWHTRERKCWDYCLQNIAKKVVLVRWNQNSEIWPLKSLHNEHLETSYESSLVEINHLFLQLVEINPAIEQKVLLSSNTRVTTAFVNCLLLSSTQVLPGIIFERIKHLPINITSLTLAMGHRFTLCSSWATTIRLLMLQFPKIEPQKRNTFSEFLTCEDCQVSLG